MSKIKITGRNNSPTPLSNLESTARFATTILEEMAKDKTAFLPMDWKKWENSNLRREIYRQFAAGKEMGLSAFKGMSLTSEKTRESNCMGIKLSFSLEVIPALTKVEDCGIISDPRIEIEKS